EHLEGEPVAERARARAVHDVPVGMPEHERVGAIAGPRRDHHRLGHSGDRHDNRNSDHETGGSCADKTASAITESETFLGITRSGVEAVLAASRSPPPMTICSTIRAPGKARRSRRSVIGSSWW